MAGCAARVALVAVAYFALMVSGDPNADPAVVLLYAYMTNIVLCVPRVVVPASASMVECDPNADHVGVYLYAPMDCHAIRARFAKIAVMVN
jgi:hypothetical protein